MKHFWNFTKVVCVLLLAWVVVSHFEVVFKNQNELPYWECNLYMIVSGYRFEDGTYYTDGTIITDDGHIWGYDTDLPDGTRVQVCFDKQGTKDITDDTIVELRVR